LFDLFMMRNKEGAIQKDKSARFACALLYAGRANCRLGRPPVFVLFIS
jgi:hypothetical protein